MNSLLRFSYVINENRKEVLSDFYAKKAQEEASRLWENETLGEEAIETLLSEHSRTPYI